MMRCPNCNTPYEEGTVFCGNCGNQVAPLNAQGATVVAEAEPTRPTYDQAAQNRNPYSNHGIDDARTVLSTSGMPGPTSFVPGQTMPPSFPPTAAPTPSPSRPARGRRVVVLASVLLALLVIAVSAGAYAILRNNHTTTSTTTTTGAQGGAPTNTSGTVLFTDDTNGQGHNDTLKIIVNNLAAAPSGMQYDAWLVNEVAEHTLPLGTLQAQGSAYTVNFSDTHTNLIGAGNKIIVTQEQGNVTAPTGTVVLSGSFPPEAFVHIRHLLFHFDTTPGNVGLLVGLLKQAQVLNSQALILQGLAGNGDQAGVQCMAQNILNITEGSQGPHVHPLNTVAGCAQAPSVQPAGDGFGLLGSNNNGYIATAAQHASLAATTPDTTPNIKMHAQHVIICTTNVKNWITAIDNDAHTLRNNPSRTDLVQQIVTLASHALNGVNLDNDETIDPVPGEGGAIQAYDHGQFMAILTLRP